MEASLDSSCRKRIKTFGFQPVSKTTGDVTHRVSYYLKPVSTELKS